MKVYTHVVFKEKHGPVGSKHGNHAVGWACSEQDPTYCFSGRPVVVSPILPNEREAAAWTEKNYSVIQWGLRGKSPHFVRHAQIRDAIGYLQKKSVVATSLGYRLWCDIFDNPDDDAPRLALADLLQMSADPEEVAQGEFIVLQCQLAREEPHYVLDYFRRKPHEQSGNPKIRRCCDIISRNRYYSMPLDPFVGGCFFRRGFLDEIIVEFREANKDFVSLFFCRHPIRKVTLTDVGIFRWSNGFPVCDPYGAVRNNYVRRDVLPSGTVLRHLNGIDVWDLPMQGSEDIIRDAYLAFWREGGAAYRRMFSQYACENRGGLC